MRLQTPKNVFGFLAIAHCCACNVGLKKRHAVIHISLQITRRFWSQYLRFVWLYHRELVEYVQRRHWASVLLHVFFRMGSLLAG